MPDSRASKHRRQKLTAARRETTPPPRAGTAAPSTSHGGTKAGRTQLDPTTPCSTEHNCHLQMTVMINFVCQLGWAQGRPDSWTENSTSGCPARALSEGLLHAAGIEGLGRTTCGRRAKLRSAWTAAPLVPGPCDAKQDLHLPPRPQPSGLCTGTTCSTSPPGVWLSVHSCKSQSRRQVSWCVYKSPLSLSPLLSRPHTHTHTYTRAHTRISSWFCFPGEP